MNKEITKKRTRQFSSEAEDAVARDKESKSNIKQNGEGAISKKLKTEDFEFRETFESKELDKENYDDQSDVEYENMNLSEYERKREENLRDNAQFMASIGIHQAKYELDLSIDSKKTRQKISVKSQLNASPKLKKVFQPTRRSARIQRIDPTGVPLPPVVIEEPVDVNPRKPPENLEMEDILSADCNKERHLQFANSLKSLTAPTHPLEENSSASVSLKTFLQNFSKVQITEERVRKVVKSRIFSVAVHPTVDKILVGAGGKWGAVGLWDVNQGLSEDAAVLYYPHSNPVNCLEFSREDPEKLFSCGYDGTLRCGHFEKKIFENIYYTPEDEDLLLRSFTFLSPHILLVSQSDGNVAFIDTRTEGYKAEEMFRASLRDVRTVDIHPTQPDYIITAGLDSALCLWDIRNLRKAPKKIFSASSGRMLNSAYFSPVTGKYILSTSQDNALRIYDSSKLVSKLPCLYSIKHDTQTGRWLTKFRATWHPSREDLFVCGSMARPRRIELFSTNGKKVSSFEHFELINSVQSLNKFHPSLNVLVGANASGKLHVFTEEDKK